ncbi:SRPBCC domain-containing protein [Streptomyces sp. NPDC053755]|uniref:SRPBCC domain-containing protein n=1 Tax=Streptomyces sp. NPDC053755 TaxID=3155815 RepID=UPI00342F3A0B
MSEIPRGRCETHEGDARLLRFVVELPHPPARVWAAVATPEGLRRWFCAAEVLEPRLGGRVSLRPLTGDPVLAGRVTAWDPEYVAEYTVDPPHARIRFHLEPGGTGGGSTVLRLTLGTRATPEAALDLLARWHDHVERLAAALDGTPADWPGWTPERRLHLRELYARDEAPWPVWIP